MRYFERDLSATISSTSREYSCLLLIGARQVGKTTLLQKLMEPPRTTVTLDDLQERKLAKEDPATFLAIHKPPLLIDEVQYAPELFSVIKMAIDAGAPPGSFWLTGSQLFSCMRLSRESLAGRIAILHLPGISQHELYGSGDASPFSISLPDIQRREREPADLAGVYARIFNGSMPALLSGKYTDRDIFYSSYVETYINRDVRDSIAKVNSLLFNDFIRAAACCIGQVLNVHSLATDVGVSDDTARRWLDVLEASDVIFFLRPYEHNLLKRVIKQKKLYFTDSGLVAYLTRYQNSELLANGALNGAILENYVVSEIRKTYLNIGHTPPLWYYRDRDKKEIDIIIEENGKLFPIEIKRNLNPSEKVARVFSLLDKCSLPRSTGAILCPRDAISAFTKETLLVPVWKI